METMQDLIKKQSLLAEIGKKLVDLGCLDESLEIMKEQIDILNRQVKMIRGGTEQ